MQYKVIRYWEYAETFYVEADNEAEALESTNDREPDMDTINLRTAVVTPCFMI